ncbi:DNA polymerase III subunit psi [Gilliamella sp. B2894]|uniref:DNA polymerase III subunit psi n=1 Tax=unclassified Gilliamella TaxID=2685620 RepID=UPI00226A3108|nr:MULTISPECIES: DNA polymerase III subunit psi [unclassified Gilliamella]MCX8655212.1 DNA polymerase III subunit psi [Gilliamella sp. B2894]MCX8694472.1 DNA polymerase III subunit psi [Gilliamella sp. B2881]MCX8696066.1 DNA polymerase III subunit psi [Gilliamella sp. B2828]
MTEQDSYLQQCNITQYILRNSTVFKGEMTIHISDEIRLIVVAEQKPTQKIYTDILNAIRLKENQVLILTPSQFIVPASDIKTVVWFIDIIPDEMWQNQLTIQTSSLDVLANAPQQKRQLWRQLCQYENYFHPHSQ